MFDDSSIRSCAQCENMNCARLSVSPVVSEVPRNRVMLIGFNPVESDAIAHQMFTRANDQAFMKLFENAAVRPWITAACKGYSEDKKPTQKTAKLCASTHLLAEIIEFRPQKLVVCGAETFSVLFKNFKFADCVNKVLELPWFDVFVCYSPGYFAYVGFDSVHWTACKRDLSAFLKAPCRNPLATKTGLDLDTLRATEPVEPKSIGIEVDHDQYTPIEYNNGAGAIRELKRMITGVHATKGVMCFDIETDTLDLNFPCSPRLKHVVANGFCNGQQALSIYSPDLSKTELHELYCLILKMFKHVAVVGHNLKFDVKPFLRYLLKPGSYKRLYDTLLMARSINELEHTYALKPLLNRTYGLADYADIDFSNIWNEDRDKLRVYSMRDVYWTRRLFGDLWPQLTRRQKLMTQNIQSDQIITFSFMEACGLPYNPKINQNIYDYVSGVIEEEDANLITVIASLGFEKLNTKSSKQLNEFVTEMGWKTDGMDAAAFGVSFDAANFSKFAEMNRRNKTASKFIKVMQRLNKHKTILSKFDGKNALSKYVSKDGRIHCSWNMDTTKTGRPSTKDPNVLNIDRTDRLPKEMQADLMRQPRHQFHVITGRVIVGADMSQAELRALTCYSKDKSYLKTYLSDGDAHTDTALDMFHAKTAETWQRQVAKSINFGKIYLQGPKGLMELLNKSFQEQGIDLRVSFNECKEFHERWNTAHPESAAWIEDQMEFMQAHGYTESWFGRRRHFNARENDFAAMREAVNHPIQSVASDITTDKANKIRQQIAVIPGVQMLKHEYDAVYTECAKSQQDRVIEIFRNTMPCKIGDYDGFCIVPFKIDIGVGKSFADIQKLKDAT